MPRVLRTYLAIKPYRMVSVSTDKMDINFWKFDTIMVIVALPKVGPYVSLR